MCCRHVLYMQILQLALVEISSDAAMPMQMVVTHGASHRAAAHSNAMRKHRVAKWHKVIASNRPITGKLTD